MIKATEELNNYKIMYSTDEEIVEESVIYCYLAIRLLPLKGTAGITENKINNIATFLANHYYNNELSLDLMINSIYNYINFNKSCPSDKLLTDDIESLLEDYSEDDSDVFK